MTFNFWAFFLTILFGSGVFFVLSHTIYTDKPSFPTQLNDGIGDTLFLPLYNGFLFAKPFRLKKKQALISVSAGVLLGIIYTLYQLSATYTDWSKSAQGTLNLGGWYHMVFFIAQASIICYGILTKPKDLKLWSCLGLYAGASILQFAIFGYI